MRSPADKVLGQIDNLDQKRLQFIRQKKKY